MITQSQLKEILQYDPATGVFTRLVNISNGLNAGDIAGSYSNGYWKVVIGRRVYFAHRLAWLYVYGVWPKGQIDHIDCNKLNNRIDNLRDVSQSVNQQNRKKARADNKSGFLGVHQVKNKFRAQIMIAGKKTGLGDFETPELAHQAYVSAKRMHHLGCVMS